MGFDLARGKSPSTRNSRIKFGNTHICKITMADCVSAGLFSILFLAQIALIGNRLLLGRERQIQPIFFLV